MTFVDTGGWYALFVTADADHVAASQWIAANRRPLTTTDYIADETLTLMRARGHHDAALDFGTYIFAGRLGHVHYLTPAEIAAAWGVFREFGDKAWSFTDCTSKIAMAALGVTTAFAFDRHFRQFGTVSVVP